MHQALKIILKIVFENLKKNLFLFCPVPHLKNSPLGSWLWDGCGYLGSSFTFKQQEDGMVLRFPVPELGLAELGLLAGRA